MKDKIHYSQDELKIYQQIQSVVKAYLSTCSSGQHANLGYFLKMGLITFIWCGLLIYLYHVNTYKELLLIFSLVGIFNTLIFLNILHDAAHQTIFKNSKYNNILFQWLNLIGGNSYIWKIRHLSSHHLFPNIPGRDIDIGQSDMVRLNSETSFRTIHKLQHVYMPIIYLTYTLFWVLFRDFSDFWKGDILRGQEKGYPAIEWWKLFLYKVVYFSIFLVLPYLVLPFTFGEIFLGFVCMHIFQSILSVMGLLTAHVNEHSKFPVPDENGDMQDCWASHQINSTNDFGTENPIINYIFGGFNFHVAHHLFPNISHVHYHKITPLIKEVIEQNGLTYQEMGMFEALLSHWYLLKKYSVDK